MIRSELELSDVAAILGWAAARVKEIARRHVSRAARAAFLIARRPKQARSLEAALRSIVSKSREGA
jgi:hypothetical protein